MAGTFVGMDTLSAMAAAGPSSAHAPQQAAAPPPMRLKGIRFRNDADPGFYRTVRRRVNRYFDRTGKRRYADWRLAAKGAFYGLAMVSSYAVMVAGGFEAPILLALAIVFILSSLLLAINVSHDAAHDALTANRTINKLIHRAIFTVLGPDPYLWRMRHLNSHHSFPNVNGCDIDIDHNAFFRLSPNQPGRRRYRFQHLYAPLVFWFVDIHTIFWQDFAYLFKTRLANMVDIVHPWRAYLAFVLGKLAYIAIVFIAPIALLPLPWWHIVAGYMIASFVASSVFIYLLIGTHFAEETAFPEIDAEGRIDGNWAIHAMRTSLDWNPESRIANAIAGGANAHAAHHLFPRVCHIHYPAISRIIRETAHEFGVVYNEGTLSHAIASHFRFLKRVGRT